VGSGRRIAYAAKEKRHSTFGTFHPPLLLHRDMNMAVAEVDTQLPEPQLGTGADTLKESVETVADVAAGESESGQLDELKSKNDSQVSGPVIIYTRPQLISLQKSSLVQPPLSMPLLKDWFGYLVSLALCFCINSRYSRSENEQNLHRKEPESFNSTSPRDRR
jgi:hypothetical protein